MKKRGPLAIMGAMTEEISSLKNEMKAHHQESVGGRDYIVGELFGIETVLVHSRWGKVASATTKGIVKNFYDLLV